MTPAALLAVDPIGLGGAVLLGAPGPARDLFLDAFRAMLPPASPVRTVPLGVSEDRLLGGLDLPAALAASRPRVQRGLLAEADRGVLILQSAERVPVETAALIAGALDRAAIQLERDGLHVTHPTKFAVIALDDRRAEGEATPAILADRLAFHLDPAAAPSGDVVDVATARRHLHLVAASPSAIEALCRTAASLGIQSLRAPLLALRTARAAAALAGRDEVNEKDLELAAQLVLAPRAVTVPAPETSPDPAPEPPADQQDAAASPSPDLLLDAVRAVLPPGLLITPAPSRRAAPQGRGGIGRAGRSGRPAGLRAADLSRGERLALLATLRAAAPFQRLRGRTDRLEIRPADLRTERLRPRTRATTIFLVDASGSQAMGRLAEAKGAVQLLLGDCYARRDEVALIAFRGQAADLLLPPTRSLARARRSLAALPGGGGTPLAHALDAGCALADHVRRRNGAPTLVLLTDGAANIARDGSPGRPAAERDAQAMARNIRAAGHRAILIDSALRPSPPARSLATEMAARYVALPFAGAAAVAHLVRRAE